MAPFAPPLCLRALYAVHFQKSSPYKTLCINRTRAQKDANKSLVPLLLSTTVRVKGIGGMTLNGGPAGRAGWRAVFPIEKHEFSAGCTKGWAKTGGPASCTLGRPAQESEPTGCTKGRAAQQSAPEGCTKKRAAQGGLHNRADCTTGRAGGLHKNT